MEAVMKEAIVKEVNSLILVIALHVEKSHSK